jgi:phosphoribosylanthranilate isomerase
MRHHIKICGLRRAEEYRACVEAGATAVGFVFFDKSPRGITPEGVRAVLAEVGVDPNRGRAGREGTTAAPWHVGVFVDPSPELLRAAIAAGLTHVQPHGSITPEAARAIAECGAGLLRPIGVRAPLGGADFAPPAPPCPPPVAWLCDTFDPIEHGGTGRRFQHDFIRPHLATHPLWIAGGLDPENVAEVIAALPGLAGVDVSSGVEFPPEDAGVRGLKDIARIRRFVLAARAAFAAAGAGGTG